MLAHNPDASVADLRSWLLDGVDLKPSFDGPVASGGRLNLARSLPGAGGADIHRPETTITSGPPAPRAPGARRTFTFSALMKPAASAAASTAAARPPAEPAHLHGASRGPHSFNVSAVDVAGNVDSTPSTRSFPIAQTRRCQTLKRKLRHARTAERKRTLRRKKNRACRTF